jgi:Domain of unknown function (DUF4184)
MPFTISHAAAAFPVQALSKHRLPLAALMVGSMTPDLVFYLPRYVEYDDSHSLSGLFTFCLPVGLLLWWFFIRVLERPTIAYLPEAWRTRITPTPTPGLRGWLAAALAVVLGALTHLIWDSFTHSETPVVATLPALRTAVFQAGGSPVRLYFVLQVLSSVFGLVVLTIWALRIPRKPRVPTAIEVPEAHPRPTNRDRFIAAAFIAVMAGMIAAWNFYRYTHLPPGAVLFVVLVGGMAGAAIGWTLVAIKIRLRSPDRASTA